MILLSTPSNAPADTWQVAAASDEVSDALVAMRAAEIRRVEVFARAARAVVCVFSDDQRGGGGSGVIIDPQGYGLTNFHVVQPFVETRRGFAGLADGKLYPLSLLGIDPGGDIAMFKIEGKQRFDYAALGDSDTLRVGQWVAAMGNPFLLAEDGTPTITLGVISGLHRYQKGQGNLLEYADCIQVSTSINPGNSGGPLFDLEGRVIGINGRASFEERGRVNVGLGYAISINQIKRFMPGLRAGRMVEHGTLGVTVRAVGDELIVSTIQAFSPAEQAGVQLGDELVEIVGRHIRTPNDYNNILATLPADWPVTLKLRRNAETLETTARLERLPLRIPLLYVVDLNHNHRELADALERSARRMRTRLPQPFSQVTFKGRTRAAAGPAADRPFTLVVGSTAVVDASSAETPASATQLQPVADDSLDPTLREEWQKLTLPLLATSEIDLRWELLAGDEVDGRIVNVVECRFDSGRRLRWKFDWRTDELLQVAVIPAVAVSPGSEPSDDQQPAAVVWSPNAPDRFGACDWPRKWTRRAPSGDVTVLEIESIEPAPVTLDQAPADGSQEEDGR